MPRPQLLRPLLLSSLLLTACAGQPPLSTGGGAYPRLMQLAQDVARRGDVGTAATLYQRATEQPDAGFDAWYRLGETRLATGDAKGAEQAFQQALGQRPEDPAARLGLGTAQLRLGATSQAEPLLRDAAQALGSATAFNRLAIANVQLGHLQAAQQAFLSASRAAPADLDARCNLALSYALSGHNQQAMQTVAGLDRAANVQPRQQRNILLVRVLAGQTDNELQTVNLERADDQRRSALIAEARQLAAIPDASARAAAVGWNDRH